MPDRPEKFAEGPRSSERRAGRLSRARIMVRMGWHPVVDPSGAWPSGLVLGPYGAAQVVNFVVSGLLLAVFAQGHPFYLADGFAA
jgi:hypothetical protein